MYFSHLLKPIKFNLNLTFCKGLKRKTIQFYYKLSEKDVFYDEKAV